MAKTEEAQTQDETQEAPENAEDTQQEAGQTEAQTAEFAEAQDADVAPGEENLDILLDITMPITVNLGKTVVPFRRLLQLGPGSVIELDKTIGQPAELFVQDIKFATGDVVVIDGYFGVKIKDVLGTDSLSKAMQQQ
ncbi:MAG: FliM/FliN family flagellar motor switch protein [Planctomycetes bacterium]|nr:FliM/FliN family flagellar motor switch protein [Planctomycetota bacterium]